MNKTDMKKLSGILADLGILVIPARRRYLENQPSLRSFFKDVYGTVLVDGCAGITASVSLAENNRAIRAANRVGEETTRTRLIRVLTDPKFYGRDGQNIKSFEAAQAEDEKLAAETAAKAEAERLRLQAQAEVERASANGEEPFEQVA